MLLWQVINTQDSVLVVTQGALTHLTRDELQAVIGHEFSHILNGDMRLNTYMLSVLAGYVSSRANG
jgi:Zn-dependent protease with chaperone function